MSTSSVGRSSFGYLNLIAWFGLFLASAIMMTWPIAGRLGSHIPGSEGDAFVHLWTFNWVKASLATGQNLFETDLLFYPVGVSLVQHNFAWFHIALWLPLQSLLGGGAAYTVVFLIGFAFTGLTTMILARHLTGSTAAGVVAGYVAAFWPYTLSHHNHPNLIFIGFLPLGLLAVDRLLDRPNRWRTVQLIAALSMIGIVRWQHFLYAAPLFIGFWLWRWLAVRRSLAFRQTWWQDERLWRTALAILGSALIMSPLLLPFLRPFIDSSTSFSGLDAGESIIGSTDFLAYFIPSRYHPLWGDWAFSLTENFIINRVFTPYVGVTTLFLIVFGLFKKWRSVTGWMLMAVILVVLALGPTLTFNGISLFPLPYRLIDNTFLATVIRRPDRFNVMLSIPLAITAAFGFQALWSGWRPARRLVLTIGLVALIALEYVTTYPTFPLTTPPWINTVLAESDTAAVLDLPMHNRSFDEYYMYYQLKHGRPLVGGHVSRPPDAAFAFINKVPLLQAMDFSGMPPRDVPNTGRQLRLLAEQEIHYLVLHKRFLNPLSLAEWQRWLVISPIYTDEEVLVYDTRVDLERDLQRSQAAFDRPLTIVASNLSAAQVGPEGRLQIDLNWASADPREAEGWDTICFGLTSPNRSDQSLGCQPLAPDHPVSTWATPEIFHGSYDLLFSPFLEKGEFQISVQPEELQSDIADGQVVGSIFVDAPERVFDRPTPQIPAELIWDNQIELIGVDKASQTLTLYWYAAQRVPDSALVFVHFVDQASDEIVWQHDGMPRDWTYPTTWWEAGEVVSDTITLPPDLPLEEMDIYIGLVDQETANRIPVKNAAGMSFADQRAPLLILDND